VFAEDIHDDFLDKAKATAEKAKLKNVRFFLGTERDPKLPESKRRRDPDAGRLPPTSTTPSEMLAGIHRALKRRRTSGVGGLLQQTRIPADPPAHIRLDD